MLIQKKKVNNIDLKGINKVLVIKLRAIGDVLISTTILPNLKNRFPNAKIHFLTEPQSGALLKYNPFIDNLITFGRKESGYLKFLLRLRKEKYDIVFDLFCNPRSAQMTFATKARYRVGYSFRLRRYAYNILLKSRSDIVHNVDFNLDELRALGIDVVSRLPVLYISEIEESFAENFLQAKTKKGDRIIGINAGGGWEAKLWNLEKFAQLADKLMDDFGFKVIIFWGPGQGNIYKKIQSMMNNTPIIPPPTTLLELAALQKRCEFIISNDSGPMHIGAAIGTPTLGIFGPTKPQLQGPLGENCTTIVKSGLECLGCNLTKCNIGNLCMNTLTVEEVYHKIIEWQKLYERK